ncbi:MAG: TatD family hydrolase, partial [Candidatus Omnitrophica bacterium]|nr:TatD family hydrolase [Candidatus Omnitrophota bacterium]
MPLIDTHVHLHFPEFQSDLDQVVERARTQGVKFFVNIGTDLASSRKSIELAERFDFVYATVGIHPHDVKDQTPEEMCELAGLAKHPKVVAIGEVGLDFYRNLSPENVQRKFIVQFFDMAKQADLPLILHIRDAYQEMIGLLKSHFKPPIRAVSHCFSGTCDIMEKLLDLGLYISFAGPVTYKKNDALREVARACPLERILMETDAPFLAPQDHRGKRNEPAFLVETARRIADLKGISMEELS